MVDVTVGGIEDVIASFMVCNMVVVLVGDEIYVVVNVMVSAMAYDVVVIV